MHSEYTSLNEKHGSGGNRGKSFLAALIFTFLGVAIVSRFTHFDSTEGAVGEIAVGPGKKTFSCESTGLPQATSVGVGMEAELQTRRWYNPYIREAEYGKPKEDFAEFFSCGWKYKSIIGNVYWGPSGENNQDTLAFQITGEQHCVVELVTPPLNVAPGQPQQDLMAYAILGIARIRHVFKTWKDLTLGQSFELLNAVMPKKDNIGWNNYMGQYRVVWNTFPMAEADPHSSNLAKVTLADILTEEGQSVLTEDIPFFELATSKDQYEYKNGASELVWQANVNLPIFIWDPRAVPGWSAGVIFPKPSTLTDLSTYPLSTLRVSDVKEVLAAIQAIENPIVRSLVAYWKNEEMSYSSEGVLAKSKKIRAKALQARKNPEKIPTNPKNRQPWYNKAELQTEGWNQYATALKVYGQLMNENIASINEGSITPVLKNGIPFVVAETRWGSAKIIEMLRHTLPQTYGDYATKAIAPFFQEILDLQDLSKYGGYAECDMH